MSNKDLYRASLIAAILSAVSWFAFVYGQLNLPALSEIDDPLQYFQTIQDTRTIFVLYGWGGTLGTLLMVPYVLAFYKGLKNEAPLVSMPTIYAFIGVTLTVLGFFKPLTALYTYAPMGLAADPEALPFLKTASSVSIELYELPWNVGSFLLFGLGIGLIAYYAWRTATGPAWLNWVGIIGGIAGITWLAAYLPFLGGPLRIILIVVNILAIIVWSIGLSFVLVRRDSRN